MGSTTSRAVVRPLSCIAGLLLCFAAPAAQPHGGIDAALSPILARDLSFSAGELADLQRGKTVRHTIATSVPGEVAAAGGVRIHASKALFLERLRDIERFKRSADVLQIGRFSDPPKLNDLDRLTVTRDDFDVKHCAIGDCGVRLSADIINRVHEEIDASAPDADARGARFFKQILFEDVTAYWSGGTDRMIQYDDGDEPIRPISAFRELLDRVPAIGALMPGLPGHLADFPKSRVDGVEDFLYWSKETFGIAPFITVTHVAIVCPSSATCIAVSKDVYSSRYLDASLVLTIASDDSVNPQASFYLLYVNRSRVNALKGGLMRLKRSIVERGARRSLEENLKSIKQQLEQRRR